jgi:LuxR family maltose regulon positive regulatory protein
MPSHFWETFSRAFKPLNPNLASTILAMGFPETMELRHYLVETFARELKARYSYAIVLDDLHLIQDGPVLDFIAKLVQLSSEQIALFAISRHDSLPNADALTKERRLFRVDENDLAFTKSELAEYLELKCIAIPNELMGRLYHDTEGVPFAVSLTADLLERNPGSRDYIRTTLRENFDALIDNELFSIIPGELQRFLVKLSLIRHLSPELINEFENGRQLMDELVRASSLIRYDNYTRAYHVHHLLLRYLKDKQDLLTDEERLEVNERAARWCISNGYRIDALSYYRATNDYEAIIRLAYSYPPVIPFDIAGELLSIFEDAPEEVLDRYPSARILYTRLIMVVGRVEEAMEKMREYIALLEARPLDGASSYTLMGLYNNLGFAKLIRCPETRDYDFARDFDKALEYSETSTERATGGFHVYNVGPYALRVGCGETGDPEKYIEMIERAIPCTTITLHGCGRGLNSLLRSEYAFFRGFVSEAEEHALSCLEDAHEFGQFEIEARALFLLVRIYLYKGRYPQVMDALSRLEALTNETGFANRHILHEVVTSWFFTMIGEFNRVESWLKNSLWSSVPNSLFDGLDDSVKIKYYLASKNYQTMLDYLDSRTARYGISRYIIGKVGMAATRAACLCQLGDKAEALKNLEKAYELAAPNKFTMQFVEIGNTMRTLSGMALKTNTTTIPTAWLENIRSRSTTYAKRLAHVRTCYLEAHDLDANTQLTTKELAVLADLAQGLSRAEISQAHNISINTVKTMLQMIYGKLGAESALDAVRIAALRRML